MTSSNPNTCQKCGKPILEGSPRGLCPLCLISAVAKTDGPVPSDAPSPELDDLRAVFPQLEILEPLGAGGMGRVYKVRQPNLDRIVALKLLPPAYAADPEWIERFTREARALARLNHPNIVQVYDFGETAPGENGERFPFLLMEFVDGVNLRQALRTGALTAREALSIVPSVCSALQYAHDQGVLHRDIKPENILLDTLGRVKIADFGLAKLRDDSAPGLTLTGTGAQLGTAAYMAPEQIEKPHEVDHRADIYSLGVVFYELLTGELPLGRFLSPSEKSGTDPRLDTIVFRTLEKERDRRFQSATDMRTEVENVANHPAPESTPEPKYGPDEWMVRCASCGRTGALAAVGGIRIGAASIGKRTTIRCSQCGGLREGIIAKLRDLPPGTEPVAPPGSLTVEGENKPRLSTMAVTGAGLVGLGIPFIFATLLALGLILPRVWNAHDNVGVSSSWATMIPILVGLLGLLPAIAGTICGWIGLAQIRGSAGALRGAGRATFAALFYPALVFIPFVGVLCGRIFNTGWPAMVGLIFAIAAIAWIARALCRHAERASENTALRPVRWPWLVGLAALGCILLVPALGLVLPYVFLKREVVSAIVPGRTLSDVVTTERPSFTGILPQGSVELIGVSRYPAQPDSWWKMDGSPAPAPGLEIIKADRDPKPGERSVAFTFKMSDLPEGTRLINWKVANADGWSMGNTHNLLTKDGRTSGLVNVTARLPAKLRTTNIIAGFGLGEWTTILESGTQSVGGATPEYDGVRWKLGWSAATETKDNRIVVNWNAPHQRDWETRVVAVKKDGSIVPTDDHTTGQDQTEWRFSGVAMSDLTSFGFQVRPVHWVEFRGIPLAPAANAQKGAPAKSEPLSREDQLIFNARQHLEFVGRDVSNPLGIAAAEQGLAIAEARGDAVKIATANLTLARTRLSHERVRRERGYPADLDLAEAERVAKGAELELEAAQAKAGAALEKAAAPTRPNVATFALTEVYCVPVDDRHIALGIEWESESHKGPELFVRSEKLIEPAVLERDDVVSGAPAKRQRRAWQLTVSDISPELSTDAGRDALKKRVAEAWLDKPTPIRVGEEKLIFSVPLADGKEGRVFLSARERGASKP